MMPSSLSLLSDLTRLKLDDNTLTGTIPDVVTTMATLV
jgi:hypothetical protein